MPGATGGAPGGTAGTGGTAGLPGGTGGTGEQQPDLPSLPSDVGCQGPDHGNGPGYYGQCCPYVDCYGDTDTICAAKDDLRDTSIHLPPGSGSCGCGEYDAGPFRRTAALDPDIEGECCYLIYEISCDGRPLVVEDTVRIARVIRRHDWGGALPVAA